MRLRMKASRTTRVSADCICFVPSGSLVVRDALLRSAPHHEGVEAGISAPALPTPLPTAYIQPGTSAPGAAHARH